MIITIEGNGIKRSIVTITTMKELEHTLKEIKKDATTFGVIK